MLLEQIKALANDTRMLIMESLKTPEANFPAQEHGAPDVFGVCVTHIQQKVNLAPSTASAHLAILQRAGLVQTHRVGKWTYYRRDESAIAEFTRQLQLKL